ncbi:hypothetical protein [Corynebacterium aquilae]|uniref:Secreted protein n=1 Tax=Corynebacterium aquilae DSM 44791 TaxID=1431546 RepID=A0A1L7CE48_9CORY|nr:hypothetical protein [Corynebacterium aquilae]APT84053.1 hypothetical protein CAQU_02045 [Corynebacterium aquilae DSM 44791]
MTPSKISRKFAATFAAGGMVVAALATAPVAHAGDDFSSNLKNFQSSEGTSSTTDNSDLNRREKTVLKYGVTTQEQIDKCKAEWADKVLPAIDRGYDFPCPTSPISQEEYDAAKAKAGNGVTGSIEGVLGIFKGFSS